MFKLKNKEVLFGINKEASEHGTPVFEKQLGDGIQAEANRDGTIFVQKGLSFCFHVTVHNAFSQFF